jgi:LuxR family maltose regulon positive regulatory protein
MPTLDANPVRTVKRGGRAQQAAPDDEDPAPARAASGGTQTGKRRDRAAAPGARVVFARFGAPRLAAGHVARAHLVRRLEEHPGRRTIVLAAPAGYGKSSLLAEWATRGRRPLAWLDLTRADDDPALLLARLGAALQWLRGPATGANGHARGARTRITQRVLRTPSELLALAEEVAAGRGHAALVLDDAHHLRSAESLEVLTLLAHSLPDGLDLALASRSEPQLRLGRLRAADRLLQLGQVQLAMTAHEAHRLVAAADVELGERELERLVERTEGWPAGIYLAASALRERTGAAAESTRASAAEEERVIAAYLREEVLADLDEPARELLTRSAVLDELSGELCDATLARAGTGPVLRELASRTLVLIPRDHGHGWYRCHSLLREVLRSELEVCEPELLPRLHARASEWFAERGQLDRAVEHAVAARDKERAGRLLWDDGALFLYGGDERVERWLRAFTAEEVSCCVHLALVRAHAHLAAGELPAARHWSCIATDALDAREREGGDAQPSLRAGVLLIDAAAGAGGIEQVGASAERADALVGEASFLRPLGCLLGGVALHLRGERENARAQLRHASDACVRTMPLIGALSLTQLALLELEDGEWEQAQDATRRALACLSRQGLEEQPVAALTLAARALVMSHRGVADEAKGELTNAARLLESLGEYMPWFEVETRILMARASTRLADVARARTLLSQASRRARRPRPVPRFVAWLDEAWGEIDDASAAALSGPGSLTMAELRVLRFLPTHLSFREIGERLHVSANTVKSQAHAVYAKLGAASRSEAVAQAAALGLIDPPVV